MSAVSPDAGKDKSSVTTAPQSSVVVPRAMLKRWRKNAFELTEWCYLQRQEGWYVKDCLERGVAKSKRCRVCKLLGEMDALLQDAAPAAATKEDSA